MIPKHNHKTFTVTMRWLLLILAALILIRGFATLQDALARARVTEAKLDRIELGMSKSQVRRVFGCDPDDDSPEFCEVITPFYCTFLGGEQASAAAQAGQVPKHPYQRWKGQEFSVGVIFDLDERVVCRYKTD